jgi:hypothetical protein
MNLFPVRPKKKAIVATSVFHSDRGILQAEYGLGSLIEYAGWLAVALPLYGNVTRGHTFCAEMFQKVIQLGGLPLR